MIVNFKTVSGAMFSDCKVFRYVLWRKWSMEKPHVMFICLNPSKANETYDDPTIKRVAKIARLNGYNGFYMCNCFPFVTTYPELLKNPENLALNDLVLKHIGGMCKDVVFAWGKFSIVRETGRDVELSRMFPNAKALILNNDGSPRHPLYVPTKTQFISYQTNMKEQ